MGDWKRDPLRLLLIYDVIGLSGPSCSGIAKRVLKHYRRMFGEELL